MSDASTPPDSITPPASPRRPWTILGRLSKAVREQNWFAVALEVVIVVIGVVIGFQVTAWGQGRADQAQEQVYLRQLAADLRETERTLAVSDSVALPAYHGSRQIYLAFYDPARPPRDSLLRWLSAASSISTFRPVWGTAEALVASGDLSLVRGDSLRAGVTAYLDDTRRLMVVHDDITSKWIEAWGASTRLVDQASVADAYDPETPGAFTLEEREVPFEDRRAPFRFEPERFLTSQEAYGLTVEMLVFYTNLTRIRSLIRDRTVAFREQVEAELNR